MTGAWSFRPQSQFCCLKFTWASFKWQKILFDFGYVFCTVFVMKFCSKQHLSVNIEHTTKTFTSLRHCKQIATRMSRKTQHGYTLGFDASSCPMHQIRKKRKEEKTKSVSLIESRCSYECHGRLNMMCQVYMKYISCIEPSPKTLLRSGPSKSHL